LSAVWQQGHNAAVAHFSRDEDKMSGRHGADVQSGTAQAWDSVRRVREPVAWALLVLAAVIVLGIAGQLFNLPGARLPICGAPPTGTSVTGPSCFELRAVLVEPQTFSWFVVASPVLSVVLVAFSGGLTNHARQVLKAAAAVQAGALILGVVSLAGIVGATGVYQNASSYISQAAGLAIAATALIFTAAVTRSQAVRARR
jgi:hypothetical protein